MVMAAFKAVGGPNAVYYVVPLLGALTVWLTFVLGSRLAGPLAGLLAAAALLVSPAFLFQLMWPMSDVPAAAWWLLAIVLAIRGTTWSCAGAGLAAALAVLTRPNLVVLVVPLLAFVVTRPARMRDRYGAAAVFMCAMLPGAIAVGAINRYLYESAFNSGYGSFSTIYAPEHFWPNLLNYAGWLLTTQTPFMCLGAAAPLLFHRRDDSEARSIAVLSLAFSAFVVASCTWYTPLQRLDASLSASRVSVDAGTCRERFRLGRRRPTPVESGRGHRIGRHACDLGVWVGRSAFHVRTDEARYVNAGRIGAGLPANAVILSNQHSGSLRYYAGRITMRFEWLDPDMYVPALEHFERLSRPVYVVLDDWEREIFKSRYAAVSDLSWLDRPPLLLAGERVFSTPFRLSVTECALDTPQSDPSRRSGQERGTRWAIMKKRSKRLTANGFLRTP